MISTLPDAMLRKHLFFTNFLLCDHFLPFEISEVFWLRIIISLSHKSFQKLYLSQSLGQPKLFESQQKWPWAGPCRVSWVGWYIKYQELYTQHAQLISRPIQIQAIFFVSLCLPKDSFPSLVEKLPQIWFYLSSFLLQGEGPDEITTRYLVLK